MKKLFLLFLVVAAGWQPASGQGVFGLKAGIQAADHAKVFTAPDTLKTFLPGPTRDTVWAFSSKPGWASSGR